VTRYEFFRKRIAPVLFLGMVGLIAYDSCQTHKRTNATIVLEFGEATPDVTSVEAELMAGSDSIGNFHRVALPGGSIGPCRFEAAIPDESAQLRIEVALRGKTRTVTKTIRPIEGSTVTVPLGDSLR
jgi:hypothetical protein